MAMIGRFGPPIGLMAVIFFLSAQPDLNSGLGTLDTIARKIVHMAEFGALWFLWFRALGGERAALAALITVAYAISDELHQTQVEGRHGTVYDVMIDTAGVLAAWLLVRAKAARTATRSL